MKKPAVHTVIVFITCTALFLLFSQTAAGQSRSGHKIWGVVKDSAGQKPLSYVTVSLYRQNQMEQAVKSTYTTDAGKFQFNNTDSGNYVVLISHTGFAEKQEKITMAGQDIEIPAVQLQPQSASLQGVTVTARKPLVEQSDDKIVFNVENDPATKTETAIDILRKTPFVSVDGEDNISVNGQTNFKVLLNGRETAMFAQNVKEALKGFPGALITKIEVITTPSAKYDAEGVGGVINIITKKKVVGYNGSLNTFFSSNRWFNVNGNFSAKFGKFGFTMFYGGGGTPGQTGRNLTQTTPSVPSFYTYRKLEGTRRMVNLWQNGNAELSYELDSLNTLSAYGNISGGYGKVEFNQEITTDFPSSPSTTSYYHLNSRNEFPTLSVGTDYIRKFKGNKEKEFSIRLNGEFGKANSFLNSQQDNPDNDRFIINNSIANNKQYTIQSDYVHPLKNGRKLETGVKAILRRAESDFESLIKYDPNHDFKINPANTDNFNYHQEVYSVYGSYSFKIKKVTYRIGARLEQTSVDGDFISSATKVKQSYANLLPNLQATAKLSNAVTLVLSYSQRMQRPFIWNLNPFVNNNDSLNISYGNPGLGPQTMHSVSAQTRISKGGTFMGLTLEGSYSNDKIVPYSSFDASTGVTRTTSLNIGREFQLSLTGNISTKINPDWNLFLNGNLRYNRVSNNTGTGQSNSGIGGNANLNSSYKINKKFTATGYAGFFRGPVTIQSKYPLNLWYGSGIGYKFFKEKLTVSMMASNFFQKDRDYRVITTDPNFTTTSVTTMPFRALTLSVNWNFGKLTENVSKKKGVTNDDLLGNGGN